MLGRATRPRIFPPNRWTREEVERRIQYEPLEWAYVFDQTGRQVFRARGGEGFVTVALESRHLRHAALVHNHPPHREYPPADPRFEGGSFSDQDLALVIAHDLAEMVAVTPGWRYLMTRPATGWVPDAESAVAYYTEQWQAVQDEFDAAVRERRLTVAEAAGLAKDEVMRRTAQWGQFDYRREPLAP